MDCTQYNGHIREMFKSCQQGNMDNEWQELTYVIHLNFNEVFIDIKFFKTSWTPGMWYQIKCLQIPFIHKFMNPIWIDA